VNLSNRIIQWSSSLGGAPIVFAKMKHGGPRLCVDNRVLNSVMVKKSNPLPLISEMVDGVRKASICMKLDLCGTYDLILIKQGDEYKTVFRTRYGQFKYSVMPFELTNAPAIFPSFFDECLRPYIDDFAICYLDNILIYSTNEKEYMEHVTQVLQRLKQIGLYCKAEK
jgi:hypothetical protein